MKSSSKRVARLAASFGLPLAFTASCWFYFGDYSATFLTAWIGVMFNLRWADLPVQKWLKQDALEQKLVARRDEVTKVLPLICRRLDGAGIQCGFQTEVLEALAPVKELFTTATRKKDVKDLATEIDSFLLAALLLTTPFLFPLYFIAWHVKQNAHGAFPQDDLFIFVKFALTGAPTLVTVGGFVVVGLYVRKRVLNVLI